MSGSSLPPGEIAFAAFMSILSKRSEEASASFQWLCCVCLFKARRQGHWYCIHTALRRSSSGIGLAKCEAEWIDDVVIFLILSASFGCVGRALSSHFVRVLLGLLLWHDEVQLLLRFVNGAVHCRLRLPARMVCGRVSVRAQH